MCLWHKHSVGSLVGVDSLCIISLPVWGKCSVTGSEEVTHVFCFSIHRGIRFHCYLQPSFHNLLYKWVTNKKQKKQQGSQTMLVTEYMPSFCFKFTDHSGILGWGYRFWISFSPVCKRFVLNPNLQHFSAHNQPFDVSSFSKQLLTRTKPQRGQSALRRCRCSSQNNTENILG